jgi:hypothetical protein
MNAPTNLWRLLARRLSPLLLALALAVIGAGCASVPEGTAEVKQKALSFTPPAGQANLYVVRPTNGGLGAGVLFNVSLDYKECGTLGVKSYLYTPIAPGKHWVGATTPGDYTSFEAEPGKNYFFKLSPGFHSMKAVPMPEEKGRELVQKYRLSLHNRFEMQASQSNQ